MTRTGAKGEGGDNSSGTGPYGSFGLMILAIITGLMGNLVLGLSRINISQRQLIDTDGYMRYARILDLLEGRNDWFDGWVHWSNSPFGHADVWTRLLDGLILILAAPLAPFTGWRDAVYWAGLVSGPLFHLVLIVVTVWVARPFVSGQVAALASWVVALQPLIVGYSSIGRLDHHLLLMILTTASFGYTLRVLQGELRAATIAGCLAGLALWVSTEALVPIALSAIALVTWWAVTGKALVALQRWVLALTATIAVVATLEHGPADITSVEYDRISLPYFTTGIAGMAGLTLTSVLLRRRPFLFTYARTRILALSVSLLAPILCVVFLYPGLLRGPFAETPQRVRDIWLSHVAEWQPMWRSDSPVGAVILQLGTPIVGVVCALILSKRSHQRWIWLITAIWLTMLIPLALKSVRFAIYPEALAGIPVAALAWEWILRLRSGPLIRRSLIQGSIIFVAAFGHLVIGATAFTFVQPDENEQPNTICDAATFASVIKRNVPKDSAILAHVDLGPVLHYTTDRNVIATPHHRNVDGILAAYDIMRSTPDIARSAIEQRQIGAIVVCSIQDRPYLDPIPPQSLAHALIDGSPPSWLTKVTSDDSEATLYLVRP